MRSLTVHVVFADKRATARRMQRVTTTDDEALLESAPANAQSGASAGARLDLERAIAALPEGARTVFVLHDVEGYGHEEIAGLLGIADGTSKAHLHKARARLKEILA